LAFTGVGYSELVVAGFTALVLLLATALGDATFVFFGISGSLSKLFVRVRL
jgi:hypothetical protein